MRLRKLGLALALIAAVAAGGRATDGRTTEARAAEAPLLECRTPLGSWLAAVRLEENGRGGIVLEHGKEKYRCALALAKFSEVPQGEVPSMNLVFIRGDCQPALSAALQSDVFRKIPLAVREATKFNQLAGTLQWRKSARIQSCTLKTFRKPELQSALKRWKAGSWGK